ncbi:radical SAM/SPASM domain-containing protein [Archaeoglobales archaeon]|nr:MAG: radical SAM/SPASM domain-containing protein [Archaeoglobales archaeon]
MIKFFGKMINNPISKVVLKRALSKENGELKLEKWLKAYAFNEDVSSLEFNAIKRIIKAGLKTFGGDEGLLKERLKDPYWRRGFISVIRGLVYFGVRKPFVAGSPFLVVWDLTYSCNLKCKHCYSTAGKPWKDELDTKEAFKALDVLADAGVTSIAFSGGEPLLRRDFFELASKARDYGIFVSVATNGTLLTKENVKRLKECGIGFVQISLDGDKEHHERFRGVNGIFEKVMEGIKNAKNEGLITCISTTATKVNYEAIFKVMDLAEELDIEWFMLYNYIPTGRGGFEIDLDAKDREILLKELWRRLNATSVNFMSTAPYYARIAVQQQSSVMPTHFYNANLEGIYLAEFIGGCGCGRFYLAMKANGDIQPCVFFPLKLTNIKEFNSGEEFLEFWKKNKVLNDLRDKDLIEICGECKYKYICGGCRARAYAYFKDYMKPDTGCIIAVKRVFAGNSKLKIT